MKLIYMPFFSVLLFANAHAASAADEMVRMITNPYLILFVLTIGLIGIAVEFLLPGLIFPGTIGISVLGLYFLGYYFSVSMSWGAPALFSIGLILLILEVVISTFGILGVLGFLFLLSSFMMTVSSWQAGLFCLMIAIGLTALFLWILSRFVKFKVIWQGFILNDSQQNSQGYISQKDRAYLLDQVGVTMTPLQSSGYARFGEQVEDVVSDGRSIPKNVFVKVIAVEGTRVVVRQIEE